MVPLHWSVPVACSGQHSGVGQAAVINHTDRQEIMTKLISISGANWGKGKKISSYGNCSPQKPLSKKPMMENQISLQSINDKPDKLISEQTNFRKSMEDRIENVYKNLMTKLPLRVTRNCSKLRKIHSGQGPISLTINPSEFKFFGQFVLLWFKFSRCQLMSLQFLHMTSMTRDPYMLSRHAQNLFWRPENEIRQNDILITLEMCITLMS